MTTGYPNGSIGSQKWKMVFGVDAQATGKGSQLGRRNLFGSVGLYYIAYFDILKSF